MELTKKDIVFPEVPHDGVLGLVLHDMQGNVVFPESKDTTYAEIWDDITKAWRDTAATYEEDPNNFYNAWNYLDLHPAFWKFMYGPTDPQPVKRPRRRRFRRERCRPEDHKPMPVAERLHVKNLVYEYGVHRCVDISVGEVLDEEGPGFRSQVWVEIELGQYSWPEEFNPADPNTGDKNYHDYKLDSDGPTVEKAIIRAAYNVWCVYGNDRRVCDAPYDERSYKLVVDSKTFEEMMGDEAAESNERVRQAARRLNETVRNAEEE